MRLTIDEYSKHFKMSKEMIKSKLREKKLNYIIENSITYIIVTKQIQNNKELSIQTSPRQTSSLVIDKQKTTVAMVLSLYQRENKQLKEKIVQLETKIDKLIDDKEQMLRQEMQKIEQVYNTKDEQIKNIIELMNTKLKNEQAHTVHDVQTIETLNIKKDEEIIELKEYLRTLDLEQYQKKVIKKRFLAVYGSDIRVIKQNGRLYLNFSKYDYSDLLEY